MAQGLSKSRYTQFRLCDKALWLGVFKPEEAVIDDAAKERFAAGTEIGEVAKGLLGDYEDMTFRRHDGDLESEDKPTCFLSTHSPHLPRRSDHLSHLAEAAAGPEDVILIFVAAPGLVGGGSAASAVLCEGSGRIDITGEEKKGSPKDAAALLSHL